MRFKKITAAAAVAAAAALVLAGCAGGGNGTGNGAGEEPGEVDEPIQVVVLGGLGAAGILADNASTSVTAALASVDAINDMGGILGREVQITHLEDNADPTVAVTKLREYIATEGKPALVMNSGPSTIAEATIPILTQNEIINFNIGPTAGSSDPSVSPFTFDLSATVPDYLGSFLAEVESRGYQDIAILHGSSAYGELFGAQSKALYEEAGYNVTGMQGFDNAALDMTAQLSALQVGDPDVLILDAYGAPLGYVLQSLEKLGWDVPIMGNTSVSATGLIATEAPAGVLGTDQVKNLTMQVFSSTQFDPDATAVNDAVERMVAAGDIRSSLILAYNYDSMFLLKAAAESAGAIDDPNALVAALRDPAVQESAGRSFSAGTVSRRSSMDPMSPRRSSRSSRPASS
ncbi:ABC transporter substrate-binding protein [Microbacterium sp. NIBRBAC000506063]|uniref:ABC transporter substrate-binding protein n=1 Tax=Microbacterium sp. NIBRBAC000506063 TaxID=2734618 RepID=UPI001BB6FC36|nr:ABC transporter substrate-binding protein [Microbacterium sp. NIBRBAC000506063]QTV79062.1 ABC transporter substrate-binding protein [Microbacterium sp. NIBRBAC000506063]